jgi:hypothetical protein
VFCDRIIVRDLCKKYVQDLKDWPDVKVVNGQPRCSKSRESV